MSTGVRLIAAGVFALFALFASAAAAQTDPSIELAWDTAGSEALCPSAEDVRGEIEQLLGQSSAPRKRITARARVRRDATGQWRVTLSTRTDERTAERAFVAATCKEAAAAAALIMALAIDADILVGGAGVDGGVAAPPSEPAVAVVPAPDREPPPASRPADPERSSKRPSLSGQAGFDVARGVLPETAVGGELGLALTLAPARLEIAGAYFAPSQALLTDQPSKGANFHRAALMVRACLGKVLSGVELAACATGSIARVGGAAFGTTRSDDGAATWADVGASGLVIWSFTRALALRLRVGFEVPSRRPRFVVESTTGGPDAQLFRPAAVALDGSIGPELRFF